MPRMVHVVQMKKQKARPMLLPVGDGRGSRRGRPFHVPRFVRRILLHQPAEALPIMNHRQVSLRPLGAPLTKQRREDLLRAGADRFNRVVEPLPLVRVDAVLLRAGPGDDRHPVRARNRRQYAARMERPSSAGHQFL